MSTGVFLLGAVPSGATGFAGMNIVSGLLVALSMASGGAWNNAENRVEHGHHGGKAR